MISVKPLRAILLVAALAGPSLAAADADDVDIIEYRQNIMKGLGAQSAILGQIVSGLAPSDQLMAHLDAMAILASTAAKSFEPNVEGGDSKLEVWSNWPDFSKRMNEFAQKTAEAAKMAHAKGPEAGLTTMLNAMNCKSCHEIYREEKK